MTRHLPGQLHLFDAPPKLPTDGILVKLDRYGDRVRPCHKNIGIISPGRGPHEAELRCSCCGQHRGWLSKNTLRFLERTMQLYGRTDALPVIRNTEPGSAS